MIEISRETEAERFEMENVMREAFWNYYSPACAEHYLVHVMRGCPAFVPELCLAARDGGKVVGGSMCVRARIDGDDGVRREVLTLGPIGVLPEYQRRGIGGALIERTAEIARSMGFRAILLCGDPDYYARRGFVPAESFCIRNAENMYADALQARELYGGALSDAAGIYFEDEIYGIDEALAAEYDKLFPPKEAVSGTETQKKFETMVKKVRPYRA